ncbi:MAG: hypothetical protein PHG67_13020 [Bacteroidales bacterium]|jgi:hypothetical protein|nr:hypothetical protein [Bacteroidales bacterium]
MSYWKLIKSRVSGKVPSINQLDEDTLALNQADGKLFGLRINGPVKEVVLLSGSGNMPGSASLELVNPPAGNNDAGTIGQIAFDDDYMYLCTGTNIWKRVPLMGNW